MIIYIFRSPPEDLALIEAELVIRTITKMHS